jgi:hypothetical protein
MRYDYNPKVTAIPDLTLFDGLSPDDPGPKALPTLAECAVHLEMLEAFQTLRQEVIHSKKLDKAFGIEPKKTTVYRKVWNGARRRKDRTYTIDKHVLKDPDFASKRKNKWTYFLQISAVRFHTWIQVVNRCLKDHDVNGAPIPRYLLLPPLGQYISAALWTLLTMRRHSDHLARLPPKLRRFQGVLRCAEPPPCPEHCVPMGRHRKSLSLFADCMVVLVS